MVLAMFVLPQFLEMFLSMHIELPIYTRILLFTQTIFYRFWADFYGDFAWSGDFGSIYV